MGGGRASSPWGLGVEGQGLFFTTWGGGHLAITQWATAGIATLPLRFLLSPLPLPAAPTPSPQLSLSSGQSPVLGNPQHRKGL